MLFYQISDNNNNNASYRGWLASGESGKSSSSSNSSDVILVHLPVVLTGYAAGLISLIFCFTVIVLPPGPFLENGALRYISDGLSIYCGWSSVFMGPCSMIILVLQLLASTHMEHQYAAVWSLLQAIGWNVVVGVQDTGWVVHYIALMVFLVGNIMYNWIASHDPTYGSLVYRRVSAVSIALSTIFVVLAFVSIVSSGGTKDSDGQVTLRSFSVAFEFSVLFSILSQHLCLIHALDAYHEIQLKFVPKMQQL